MAPAFEFQCDGDQRIGVAEGTNGRKDDAQAWVPAAMKVMGLG
jgi:hypothetical protein